jgi:hypothetical protein
VIYASDSERGGIKVSCGSTVAGIRVVKLLGDAAIGGVNDELSIEGGLFKYEHPIDINETRKTATTRHAYRFNMKTPIVSQV